MANGLQGSQYTVTIAFQDSGTLGNDYQDSGIPYNKSRRTRILESRALQDDGSDLNDRIQYHQNNKSMNSDSELESSMNRQNRNGTFNTNLKYQRPQNILKRNCEPFNGNWPDKE